MGERDAFGSNLRRLRLQRGISLEHIAASTKVGVELWAALEQNNFARWPTDIYARAYVRAYAREVGADPETTVEAFCRFFPNGDRRAERVLREQSAIVGHDLQWRDDLVGSVTHERRSTRPAPGSGLPALAVTWIGRLLAAALDLLLVTASSAVGVTLFHWRWAFSLAVGALAYHAVWLVAIGCTPTVWAIETYLVNRHPHARHASRRRFLRLVRNADRANA